MLHLSCTCTFKKMSQFKLRATIFTWHEPQYLYETIEKSIICGLNNLQQFKFSTFKLYQSLQNL